MKRIAILFLILVLLFSLSACGEKSGGQPSAPSPLRRSKQCSIRRDGKGRSHGMERRSSKGKRAITIDKVASPDPDIFINKADDGFAYTGLLYLQERVR